MIVDVISNERELLSTIGRVFGSGRSTTEKIEEMAITIMNNPEMKSGDVTSAVPGPVGYWIKGRSALEGIARRNGAVLTRF